MAPGRVAPYGQRCTQASISLPEDLIRLLDLVAEIKGSTRSQVARNVLRESEGRLRLVVLISDPVKGKRMPVQHYLAKDAWAQLVAPALIARTRGDLARGVIAKLLSRWGSELDFTRAVEKDENGVRAEFASQMDGASLGLISKRFDTLIEIASHLVVFGPPENEWDVRSIKGLGQYAADSYRIFYLGELDLEPVDETLRSYLGLDKSQRKK